MMTHYLDGNSHLVFVSSGLNPRATGPWLVARRTHMAGGMHRVKTIKGDAPGGLFGTVDEAQQALDAYAADKRWRVASEEDLRGYGMSLEVTDSSQAMTLAEAERERLEVLEHVIRDGIQQFVAVGSALLEIHDRRLYRSTHATFRDYCRDRWGFSDRHGRRLIAAAEVAADLAGDGTDETNGTHGSTPVPENERQLRPLVALPPEERREVWAEAVEREEGLPPTATTVRAVVNERRKGTWNEHVTEADIAPADESPKQAQAQGSSATDEPGQPESQLETLEPLEVDWRPSREQAALIGREVVNIATGERHSIRSVAVQLVLSNGVRIWTESQSAWQLVGEPPRETPLCLRVRPGMRLRSRRLSDWVYEVLSVDQSHGQCVLRHIEDAHGALPDGETEDYDIYLGSIEDSFEEVTP